MLRFPWGKRIAFGDLCHRRQGILNLVDANGQTYSYNYFFYPNTSRLTFFADTPGRHTMSFAVGGISSNPVVIDVTGTVTMTYAQQATTTQP
jgi:hypothetical protein